MLRTMLCVAVALFVCADVALAAKKTGPKTVSGVIKSVDATANTVTVTVKKKSGPEDKDFAVVDDTKITLTSADGTTNDLTGKDRLKDPGLKAGAKVKVTCDADGKVTGILVGAAKKKKAN
jgi:hypothetical protein